MQSLPVGPNKDIALNGIFRDMCYNNNDPQAAMDMASGIGDSNRRTEALKNNSRELALESPHCRDPVDQEFRPPAGGEDPAVTALKPRPNFVQK